MFTVKYLNIKLKMEYKNSHSNNLARFSNLGEIFLFKSIVKIIKHLSWKLMCLNLFQVH